MLKRSGHVHGCAQDSVVVASPAAAGQVRSVDAHEAQRLLTPAPPLAGFEKPSAIQQKGIVPFTKGLDVIQQAQSGTGKTATFCAGILNNLDYDKMECQALVLAPTRELAQQIDKVMRHLGDYLKVKSHACVGGTSVRDDTQTLQRGVHVVVGTPGRVFDMLRRGALRAESIKMFVLDEADEMLSRGFKDQIYDIFRMIPGSLQVRHRRLRTPTAQALLLAPQRARSAAVCCDFGPARGRQATQTCSVAQHQPAVAASQC